MADLIAILAIGLQYSLIVSIIDFYFGKALSVGIVAAIFASLASVGLAVWHRKKSWQTVKQWRKLILVSLVLGLGFFSSDLLLAYLRGHVNPLYSGGGLLGLPLTLAICPGFTMIAVGGLLRAFYINGRAPTEGT